MKKLLMVVVLLLMCSYQAKAFEVGDKQRIGIYEATGEGGGWINNGTKYNFMFEVLEIERQGYYSKIKILKSSGAPDYILRQAEELCPEWIKSDEVYWFVESERIK